MAFGSKVDHRTRAMLSQQAADQIGITDVALHQLVPRIALQAGQGFRISRVSEFVQVDHGLIAGGQPVQHEIGANESGAAGDKKGHDEIDVNGCNERKTCVPGNCA